MGSEMCIRDRLKLERLEADDDKLTAVFLLVLASHEMCVTALNNLQDRKSIGGYLHVSYDYLNFGRMSTALSAVPLHELRSQGMIEGLMNILDCIDRIVRISDASQEDLGFEFNDWNEVRDAAIEIEGIESRAFASVTSAVEQSRSFLRTTKDEFVG